MHSAHSSRTDRSRLSMPSLRSSSPIPRPANGNITAGEEANRYRAQMTENAQRNEVMLTQIIKPHFFSGMAATEGRIEAIAAMIAPIVLQNNSNAEEIVSVARFANRMMPGTPLTELS